ncbi:unnamed protein product [Tilletia caries]|uniref:J domain-containing protein n=1 Tax=Tilletia caries TaxID=13290 RepID=A0ABN7IM14_9BASI|nr:unnamed protein product [Tilletia caries]CAD6910429.1 unnamed protein product [Tilletia caries]CAD7069588.1 unnamed protein product [Tilletia caries]
MGNEAGDLDSLASSIALSYLLTHLQHPAPTRKEPGGENTLYAPLIQTAAADLYLRPENVAICKFADIDSSANTDALLTIDALEGGARADAAGSSSLAMDLSSDPRLAKGTSVSFGIVDHPALIPRWGPHENRDVRYLVDHHKDEGAHPDAEIRFMLGPGSVPAGEAPIGSASSMIVELFQDELLKAAAAGPAGSRIPKAVADLLISAIVIDTDNLRPVPRGRATPRDVLSHAILLPLSSFAPGPASGVDSQFPDGQAGPGPSAPSAGGSDGTGGADFGGGPAPPSSEGGSGNASMAGGSKPSSGATDSLAPEQDAMSEVDDVIHCDGEEPAIFVMSEDVEMEMEMEMEGDDVPPTPLRSGFRARCNSESTTRGCSGGCGTGSTRPSVNVDEPPPARGGAARMGEEPAASDDDDAETLLMEEMARKDLYKILGLKRGVDQLAIRTAYRREALKCHPDRARSLRDAERRTCRFKLLVNAYEILSDPLKRRQYDLSYDPLTSGLHSGMSPPDGSASYASSSFSYSYSSSYNSSSFFDHHGSSFSSSSYFSASPPPPYASGGAGGGGGGGGGFRAGAGGGKGKYETYEELKAEELARTETRTVSESLFSKPTAHAPQPQAHFQPFSVPYKISPSLATVDIMTAAVVDTTNEMAPPTTTTTTTAKPAATTTSPAAAAAAAPAPTPKTFTFVWESPAESLRRARARPGGMAGKAAASASASGGIGGGAARLASAGGGGGAGGLVYWPTRVGTRPL